MRNKIDIRRAIKERKYTIKDVANRMGVKPQNIIQNMINGNPSLKKLEEIAVALNCDITDLFYPITQTALNNNTEQKENGDIHSEVSKILPDTSIKLNEPTEVKTTAFCPHCGAKVRVGVVLLAE